MVGSEVYMYSGAGSRTWCIIMFMWHRSAAAPAGRHAVRGVMPWSMHGGMPCVGFTPGVSTLMTMLMIIIIIWCPGSPGS